MVENILLKTRFDVHLDEVSGEQTPVDDGSNGEKGKPDICCIGIHKLIHDGVFVDKFSLHDVSIPLSNIKQLQKRPFPTLIGST